ncbi:MAG: tetratricopeptide repeat protein [Bacteroidota bacterium]
MIRALPFICFFLVSITLEAQSLNGKIYSGIGEQPLPGVAVRIKGYTQTRSDNFGEFVVRLPGKEKGSRVNLGLLKDGYAVINREILKPRIPSSDNETLDIYMCPTEERDKLALQHYRIRVDNRIERNFKEEAKILADRLEFEKIGELTQKKKQAEKMIDSLAARLAKFDPEFASKEHTLAMQYFEKGELEEAFKIIDPIKIKARIQARDAKIAELKAANNQDIQSLVKAGDLAVANLDFPRAEVYYKAAVDSDTTKFVSLALYTKFLFDQNKSQELLPYARMYLRQAKGKGQEGIASIRLGDAFYFQRQPEKAIAKYKSAISLLKEAEKEKKLSYQTYLGIAYGNKANSHDMLYQYKEAIANYDSAMARYDVGELSDDPENQLRIALVKENLGLTYLKIKEYNTAISFLEESKEIIEQLVAQDEVTFLEYLPSIFNNLGTAYYNASDLDKSKQNYEEANEAFQKAVEANPARFEPNYSTNLYNLGNVYSDLKEFDTAISYYEKSLEIYKKLTKNNPERYNENLGNLYTLIGITFENLYNYEAAERNYQRAITIKRDLVKRDPELYQASLAKTLTNAALVNGSLGNFSKAKDIQLEAYAIKKSLALRDSIVFADALGRTCYNLGMLEILELNFESARAYFQRADSCYSLIPQTKEIVRLKASALDRLKFIDLPEARFNSVFEKAFMFSQIPQNDSANIYFMRALDELEKLSPEIILNTSKFVSLLTNRLAISTSITQERKYDLRGKYLTFLKKLQKEESSDQMIANEIVKTYANFSHDCIMLKRFEEAEKHARKACSLDEKNQLAISNLASSLLFQGKYKQAKKIYLQWKDEEYEEDDYEFMKELFLEDLNSFEKAGIIHPDTQKIKELLDN